MDITRIAAVETTAIHIKNASGEPLYDDEAREKPVRIHVYGPGSKQHAAVEARQSNRALKRMQENDGRITAASSEERAKETAEDLAALTVSFENLEYPPAGKAKGEELYTAFYLDRSLGFITQQVTRALADWGNFKAG